MPILGPAARAAVVSVTAGPSVHSALYSTQTTPLIDGLKRAVGDRRRVDELVTLFSYDGHVSINGVEAYKGQGAVKRFFSNFLLEGQFSELEVVSSPVLEQQQPTTIRLALTSTEGVRRFDITPLFDGGLVHALGVAEVDAPPGAKPLLSPVPTLAEGSGPTWETFDGRVRQKIWQHYGLFEVGNTMAKETLELTTGRVIMVVDETVWSLYGDVLQLWADSVDLKLELVVAPGNEDRKTMETFTFLLDELKRVDPLRRSEPVLAIGGGVLTDTVGFACACWRRGIPWARLPTTLLGVVDASVGIKVAINYHRKNGVGHFFSPIHTFIDTSFLGTVALPDIRSGVGEIMKAALVHDARLWEIMHEHGERLIEMRFQGDADAARVIKLSIDAMLECIGPDLWEEALLRPMDFGHSFSRTLEADESFQLRHGEAVAIDCVMSSLIAEQKGLLPSSQADELLQLYNRLGLPCSIQGITADTYMRARDEITVHRDGLLRAPLPGPVGQCTYVDEITDEEITRAFARLQTFMAAHPEVLWNPSKSFNSDA